jgi:hypothetical protein
MEELMGAIAAAAAGALGLQHVLRKRGSGDLLLRCRDAYRLGDGEEGPRLFAELEPALSGFRDRMHAAELLFDARAFGPTHRLLDKAAALRPGDPRGQRLRARLSGRLMEAEGVGLLRTWLDDVPTDLEARLELGELLLALGRPEEGLSRLRPALVTHAGHSALHSLLGRAHFAAGSRDRSRVHLLEAQRLRARRKRQIVPLYDTGMESGYDFRVAVQGRWEEDRDWMLLDQIGEGPADSDTADFVAVGVDGAKTPAV